MTPRRRRSTPLRSPFGGSLAARAVRSQSLSACGLVVAPAGRFGTDKPHCSVRRQMCSTRRRGAVVPLPRGLPSDAKLLGDLGPADAEVDSAVDERIKLRLRLISRGSTALEPLQRLRHGPPRRRLRGRGGTYGLGLRLDGPRPMPRSITRPAPRLRHASSMRDTPSGRGRRRLDSETPRGSRWTLVDACDRLRT